MFSVPGSSPRSSSVRRITLATAGLLVASGVSLTSTSADAALSNVGPVDPATNFPAFYTDGLGLSLQPCLDGPPRCPTTAAELLGETPPEAGEGFYYTAQSSAGGIDISLDLEMAFAEAGAGQQVVFQRTQYSARPGSLQPNSSYTITDPFGTAQCTSNPAGQIPNNACRTETVVAAGNFTTAMTGRIGPFLVPTVMSPPYLSDGGAHPVTGSPTNFNRVEVRGPGISGNCGSGCDSNDQFLVLGKLAPGAMGSLDRTTIAFGAQTGPVTQHVNYRSIGTNTPISVGAVSATAPFAVTGNTCAGALPTGATCGFDVTFTPTPGVVATGAATVTDQTGTKVIALSGKGRLGVASLSRSSVVLADTKIGKERSDIVAVTNTGDLDLTLAKASFAGKNRYDYHRGLTPGVCLPGATLAPGASCNLRVIFEPRAKGIRSTLLNVATSVGTQSVSLAGTGTGKDRVAPVLKQRTPAKGAKRVKRGENIVAGFSEAVRGVDKSSMRLANARSGKVVKVKIKKLSGGSWRLDPKSKLKADTDYRVRLIGVGSGIRDRAGNRLPNSDWKFHTRG
jgi:Bacterial Ig-like domain